MKRLSTALVAVGLMMAMAIPASAAELHEPHQGTTCEFGFKQLHFVHNQHDGEGSLASTIDVTFSLDGGPPITVFDLPATKANGGTVHFTIDIPELGVETTLVTAVDDIVPGMLVLSDYECYDDPGGSGSGGGYGS